MAYPTRGQVKQRFLIKLDDPLQETFKDPYFDAAFEEAFDCLYNAFLNAQVPRIELMISTTVDIGVKQLTPSDMGIEDFGDYIFLRERQFGSNNRFIEMQPVDVLSQRQPTNRLIEYNWRNNTFYFIGATNIIELEVKFDSSGHAPTDDSVQIGVDASLNFLANYAVGTIGAVKGYDEIAAAAMRLAVGPKFDEGLIGGMLFALVGPLVRSRQKVQIAPKPYSAWRRWSYRRALPYVAAQGGTTGGGSQNSPIQASTATGSISGSIDGVNAVFTINNSVASIETVFLNGVALTGTVDYIITGKNQVTFVTGQIPQPTDLVTIEYFAQGSM